MTRRRIHPKWIQRLFRELSEPEKELVVRAMGCLPMEPSCGTQQHLLQRAQRGEVGFGVMVGEDGGIAAVTFFEVETFEDGAKDFVFLVAVSTGPTQENLLRLGMPQMEDLARKLGCSSMSCRTIRPGVVANLTKLCGWYPSEVVVRKLL